MEIKNISMIDKVFWEKVSEEWKKADDGIAIPELDEGDAGSINPEEDSFGDLSDLDIDDILSDFDF